MLCANLTDSVTISGSLYDDWHIAPGEPMMRKEKTMNNNREIGDDIEPGKAPYTAVLEDSLEHRKALVGGEIECISLPHETVLCCNAGGKGWACRKSTVRE